MTNDIIIRRIYSKKTLERLRKKINYLGSNTKVNLYTFLNIKLILLVIIFIGLLLLSKYGYILAPVCTVAFYLSYDYLILDIPIKRRENVLEHDAIFFFEVLSLSLQSDRNLKKCLEITSSSIDNELSKEVKTALKEVKLGKSLTEALTNMRSRIKSESIDNLLLNLIEANMYGNNIIDALNNQIVYITDKRILKIKGEINKMPMKVSIISVLFFIPIIMLLVLAPVLITYFIK